MTNPDNFRREKIWLSYLKTGIKMAESAIENNDTSDYNDEVYFLNETIQKMYDNL